MDVFKLGDVCITQNGETFGLINDGSTVVMVAIDPSRPDCYHIRKIDGQPFVAARCDGVPTFGNFDGLWACPHHLRKPDLCEGWSDAEAIEQRSLQQQLEAAVFRR